MFRRMMAFSVAVCALMSSGCGDDDNPVKDDHEGEHAEAVGFVIRNSGVEIVRSEGGTTSGEIEVGHEKETPLLSVRFIDEDGDLFTPHSDDGFALGWEIADESIAEIEQHEEDGAWAFHVAGLTEGQTILTLKLNHEGHADFVSLPIEIHVEEGGPGEDHDHEGEEG